MNSSKRYRTYGQGFFCALLLSLAGGGAFWLALAVDIALPFVLVGIFQLVYLGPAMVLFRRQGASSDFAKGFWTLAVLVALLNAACFGLVSSAF